METRAGYVLIGLFTVTALLAAMGFFLWLAKVQIDSSRAQYDILFDDVTGLGPSSTVSYNGVDVGEVLAIALDRTDPSKVRVRIEVVADTPVRIDTVARLTSQGVTGVSFVALEGGLVNSPRLSIAPGDDVPLIQAELSTVQGLIEDAPDLLSEAIDLLRQLSEFTNDENSALLTEILRNVEAATAQADTVLANLTTASDRISVAAEQIGDFTARLGPVVDSLDDAMASANGLLDDRLPAMITNADSALAGVKALTEDSASQVIRIGEEARLTLRGLSDLTSQIANDPARFFLGNQTPVYTR